MNQLEHKRFAVNMYDIFANFLPGFILIGGFLLPFLGDDWLSNINLLEGSFLTLAAFAMGGVTQAIGSRIKRYQFRLPLFSFPADPVDGDSQGWVIRKRKLPFNVKMEAIKCESDDLSFAEKGFLSTCEEIFKLDKEQRIDDWGYLFKMIISYLETSPHNRTLRIQAQHLAARGLYVTLFMLFSYYLLFSVVAWIQSWRYFSIDMREGISSVLLYNYDVSLVIWPIASISCLLLSYILYIRSIHFEEDVPKYMISEITIAAEHSETKS